MLWSICYLQLHEVSTELSEWGSGSGGSLGDQNTSLSHVSTLLSHTLGNGKVGTKTNIDASNGYFERFSSLQLAN